MKKLSIFLVTFLSITAFADDVDTSSTSSIHHGLLHNAARRTHSKMRYPKPAQNVPNPYSLTVSETSQFGRNHYSTLDSKSTGNTTSISFDVNRQTKWDWGVNYSFIKNKTITYYNTGVARSTTNTLTPYGTYHITPELYVSTFAGGIASKLSINQLDGNGNPSTGVGRSFSWILGTNVGLGKLYGIWYPSITMGGFFYGAKSESFSFNDGTFSHASRTQFWQGDIAAQMNVMLHDNFQPYAKLEYDSLLRRTKNYVIKTRDGWTWAGGANFFNTNTINAGIEYRYQKMGSGAKQSGLMLKLTAHF